MLAGWVTIGMLAIELELLNMTTGFGLDREVTSDGKVNVLSVDIFETLYFSANFNGTTIGICFLTGFTLLVSIF